MKKFPVLLSLLLACAPALGGVGETLHNLSVDGPAPGGGQPEGACSFCHTPHNSRPAQGLWSGAVPGNSYTLYESATLEAEINQPTGSSRLCLSCHDGTIAQAGFSATGRLTGTRFSNLRDPSSLELDLSDDHPISFIYDSTSASRNVELVDPLLLPHRIKLEEGKFFQCTTCHDPHESQIPRFLVTDNRFSKLCMSCHKMNNWPGSVHAIATDTLSGRGVNPLPLNGYPTVAENGCGNCHRPHSAGHSQWLLRDREEEQNCLICHDGSISDSNVETEFQKFSSHPIAQSDWVHVPGEDPFLMRRHVTCGDCHNPHSVVSRTGLKNRAEAGRGIKGITQSGARTGEAQFEYETCYGCHGLVEQQRSTVQREDPVTNARLEFDPGNSSYHPVVAPGRNTDIAGLNQGYNANSVISCTDCHYGDAPGPNSGTRSPHGSLHEPILGREYQLGDPSPLPIRSYDLCYACHERNILMDLSQGFPHRLHVEDHETSCAVCHDAHGSRRNRFLINFMLHDKTRNTVVSPTPSGRLEFLNLGKSSGQCFLVCHGSLHEPKSYPN